MADDKKKDGGEPVLEFFWDSLELAVDQTYSTTLRIKLTGWWEGGKPKQVGVSVYERGQEPPAGDVVRIQKGFGTHPLTGLEPGHHYLVVVYIGERLPVQKMIIAPELPKPKSSEEEALESERIQLERAKLAGELKKIEPPKPNRKIELLGIVRLGNEVIGITICRLGKDGKPESGEVSAFDGLLYTWTMEPDENEIVAVFKLYDRPRKIVFFLSDDREVKASVDVPAKAIKREVTTNKDETVKVSASQRIKKAFQRGLRGGE